MKKQAKQWTAVKKNKQPEQRSDKSGKSPFAALEWWSGISVQWLKVVIVVYESFQINNFWFVLSIWNIYSHLYCYRQTSDIWTHFTVKHFALEIEAVTSLIDCPTIGLFICRIFFLFEASFFLLLIMYIHLKHASL